MQKLIRGDTVADAIKRAVERDRLENCVHLLDEVEAKSGRFSAWAPPLFWGAWVNVWAQIGVVGPDKDRHVTYVNISFETVSEAPSSFDVEIKGADVPVRTYGPGSTRVSVSGNVATQISARFRSHTVGQIIEGFAH